jgi:hypothetical protein
MVIKPDTGGDALVKNSKNRQAYCYESQDIKYKFLHLFSSLLTDRNIPEGIVPSGFPQYLQTLEPWRSLRQVGFNALAPVRSSVQQEVEVGLQAQSLFQGHI